MGEEAGPPECLSVGGRGRGAEGPVALPPQPPPSTFDFSLQVMTYVLGETGSLVCFHNLLLLLTRSFQQLRPPAAT